MSSAFMDTEIDSSKLEQASKDWAAENPELIGFKSFEERWNAWQDKADKETKRRLEELEKQYPLAERIKNIGRDDLAFLNGEPIVISALQEELGHKEWIWENYIARGHITLLSALWKAGKSTLLRALLRSMQDENEFAGQPTKKCNVLVISEESASEWVEKREDFELSTAENIFVWARPVKMKLNTKQWVDFVKELVSICEEKEIHLIIIDTLSTFWPVDNENDAPQMMKSLIPFYGFTEKNIAVLLIHHFRKSGGNEATASRGSGALPGFVDNIIEFTRLEATNAKNTQRLLRTYGRFNDVVPEIVIELDLDTNTFITKGTKYEVSKIAKVERIIAVFEENKEGLSTRDVVRLWDDTKYGDPPNERTVRRYISELRDKNILVIIKEEVVRSKKTPFYALKGSYKEQLTIAYPLTHSSVLTAAFTADSQKSSGTHDGLKVEANNRGTDSVNSKESTFLSPESQLARNLIDYKLPEWEEPPAEL